MIYTHSLCYLLLLITRVIMYTVSEYIPSVSRYASTGSGTDTMVYGIWVVPLLLVVLLVGTTTTTSRVSSYS